MKGTLAMILSIVSACIWSCSTKENKQAITASRETSVDTAGGSCPYITKDNKNNVLISWIKQVDSATSIVCYAVSADEGKTFGKPVEIPGSTNVHPHGENMPKLICKQSGQIIAAWGAANPNPNNQYAGLVYYSQSFDEGKTWTKAKSITADTTSYDQRYFDMALLPDGEAALVWLDNRKQWKGEGSGLFYAVTKGNEGFQNEKRISGPCCQCCRTDIYVDRGKNVHVLYRAIIDDSIRDIVHIVSADEGRTFTKPERIHPDNWVIKGCPHTGPVMTENKEGLHFTWFTGGNGSGICYNNSKDNGKTFSARDTVSGKSAMHCQMTSLSNDNILVVWNESFPDGDTFSSRIGIGQRDRNGTTIHKQYMTAESVNASFPVIFPLNAQKALVAYTGNINGKDKVFYRQVSVD